MNATITRIAPAERPRAAPAGSDEWVLRIGSAAGIVGSLLAMVGNLLHPATPLGDPEGVARTIAESETWMPVNLAIVVGLILMLGGELATNAVKIEQVMPIDEGGYANYAFDTRYAEFAARPKITVR